MTSGKVVVVASQKGGVGKTTLALNVSFALARRSRRTLLIDADPQGSVGYSIQGEVHERPGLVEVLAGSQGFSEAVIRTRLKELDLLPVGSTSPATAFAWSAALEDGAQVGRLLDDVRRHYDLVLVDTPPTIGGVTLGLLLHADFVVLPLQAEPLAARAVRHLLSALATLRQEGAQVQLAGLVLTMLQSRQESSLAVAEESWRLFPDRLVFDAAVPRDPAILEASAAGVPVGLLHRRPPAVAAVFDQIAAELETRIGLDTNDEQAIPLLG